MIVSSADRHDADVERQAARPAPASDRTGCPAWARWNRARGRRYTIGVEEELMLLDPSDFALVQSGEKVLRRLSGALRPRTAPETHAAVIELNTGVHADVPGSVAELSALRGQLHRELRALGLTAASAGAYPLAYSGETRVSGSGRSGMVADSMRMLVRREPTLALHVHIGVPDPEDAIRVLNGLRTAVPVLVALSANSPFSRGRDTGFASARTVIFQGFPRTGTARRFADYGDYVAAIDALIASGALPDPSFLWWDVRLQPTLGTVEVRVMDAQSTVADSAAIIALVQSLARLTLESEPAGDGVGAEVLAENRFLAARDGLDARLIAPPERRLVPARVQLNDLVARCRAHAGALGCEYELDQVGRIAVANGAECQRARARVGGLVELVKALSELFPVPSRRGGRVARASG
jgi:glutamate---cysteine ligase / carboxylate-amine ligase